MRPKPPSTGKGRGVEFLRANVNFDGPECLIWPMWRDNHGYGVCGYNGRRVKAARFMCELINGPAPSPKHHAAHSCGRGQHGCVHPKHVWWATPKENMQESVRLGAVKQPGQPKYKLTPADVAEIRRLGGTLSYGAIGARFGVKGKQIGKILRGEQWPLGVKTYKGKPVGSFPHSHVSGE